jgi:hypothetical protein
MRATDAERAKAASAVDAAVADGRLTWTEHSERYGQIWAAQTRGELLPPLADLGGSIDTPVVQRVTAVFSKVARATSAATQQVHAKATFGAIVLDLTAMRPNQEILVHASSFCGKILIMVPDDATVVDQGRVLLGKRAAVRTSPPPGGPVVRIDGKSSLGNLKVRRASQGQFDEPHHMSMAGQLSMPGQVGQIGALHLHQDQHVHIHRGKQVHIHGGHHGHDDGHHRKHHKRHKRGGW